MKNLENAVVLSDFDGTVTTFDTNVKLYEIYGDTEIITKNRQEYADGKIDFKELMSKHFNSLNLSKDEYIDYISSKIELQKGFKSFYNNLKENNIPFKIVSGGFITGIEEFLGKHGLEEIMTHAHRLIFDDRNVEIEHYEDKHFPHLIHRDDYVDFKLEIVKNYKKIYDKVIFLGDGRSDISIVDKSDHLFAKDYLEDYCIENNIDYIKWEDFYDVNKSFGF